MGIPFAPRNPSGGDMRAIVLILSLLATGSALAIGGRVSPDPEMEAFIADSGGNPDGYLLVMAAFLIILIALTSKKSPLHSWGEQHPVLGGLLLFGGPILLGLVLG
jgi:hypothetical protein